jgi:hypothetical protein
MLHAETSALLAYGTSLPKGARIYSTLMPCQMCRAFLERFSTGGDFVVYYGQYDPTHKASGSKDVNKYVLLSNPSTKNPEKPIWDPDSDKRRGELRDTVTSRLNRRYEDVHAKKRDLGIIDFIKGDDKTAAAQLRNAANYLQVKQQKYTDAKLAAIYNQNVKKCLEHITTVLQDLGLPGPVKL